MNEKKKNRRSEMKTKGNSEHIKFIKTKSNKKTGGNNERFMGFANKLVRSEAFLSFILDLINRHQVELIWVPGY